MRTLAAALVLLCTPALAADPTGAWSGTYTCGQGLTSVDLVLQRAPDGNLRGVFHFFAHPTNPRVPEGCFTLSGTMPPSTQHISLRPVQWLAQPPGFVMVGVEAELDPLATSIDGRVMVNGCSAIHLEPTQALLPARQGCRIAP